MYRLAITLFAVMVAVLLLWARVAKVDIVVVAQGKLVPANFVPVAQPSENGILRKILVKDGAQVEAGQPLIEMDPVYAEQDTKAAQLEVTRLEQQLERANAELENRQPTLTDPVISAEFASRRTAYQAALSRAELDLATQQARQLKAAQLAPVADRQAQMLAKLKDVGFVSEAAYNDKLSIRLDTENEVRVQTEAVKAAAAAVATVKADYRKNLMLERSDLSQKLTAGQAELAKRLHRSEMTTIKAPVAGTVTGLAVHTPGQVLTAGAPLMSLVPKGESLRFEGWLRNEDSGLVMPGMPSKVKLAAYQFQKYGWLDGELSWLGVDSETPDSMKNAAGEPLFYRVRVALPAQHLVVDGIPLPLKPGQQATADVQVGTRTVLEFLTSPVRKIILEAGREK